MGDPIWYALQIVFFVISATMFLFFLAALHREFAERKHISWEDVTGRDLWILTCVVSSFIIVVNQFDPRGLLGIYSMQGIYFLEYLALLLEMLSYGCAVYLYICVYFLQHLSQTPKWLKILLLAFNIVFFMIEFLLVLVGSITDNAFFFDLNQGIVMPIHQIQNLLVWDISLCQVAYVIKKNCVMKPEAYQKPLRKMYMLMFFPTVLMLIGLIYEFSQTSSVSSFGQPITPYDNDVFNPLEIVTIVVKLVLNLVMLYAIRRPRSSSRETTSGPRSERISSKMSREASQTH